MKVPRLAASLILCLIPWAFGPGEAPPVGAAVSAKRARSEHAVHPQDGPDVDLRVRIADARLRYSVQLNLAFLDAVVDAPREDQARVDPAEEAAVADALRAHYEAQSLVTVDGIAMPLRFSDFEVEAGEPDLVAYFPKQGLRALSKVRFVLEAALKSPPTKVALRWLDYPEDTAIAMPWMTELPKIAVVAELTAGAASDLINLSLDEPEYTWHRPPDGLTRKLARVPTQEPPAKAPRALWAGIAGLMLAGLAGGLFLRNERGRLPREALLTGAIIGLFGGLFALWPVSSEQKRILSAPEALAIFRPLHANIYAAFDYDTESEIFDTLAQSVAGDLLEELYLSVHESLILEEAGNAVARVDEVAIAEAELLAGTPMTAGKTFVVRARWRVKGSVFHFRHTHERTSEYLARYTVAPFGQSWRIIAHEPLEQRRLDPNETPPRGG